MTISAVRRCTGAAGSCCSFAYNMLCGSPRGTFGRLRGWRRPAHVQYSTYGSASTGSTVNVRLPLLPVEFVVRVLYVYPNNEQHSGVVHRYITT